MATHREEQDAGSVRVMRPLSGEEQERNGQAAAFVEIVMRVGTSLDEPGVYGATAHEFGPMLVGIGPTPRAAIEDLREGVKAVADSHIAAGTIAPFLDAYCGDAQQEPGTAPRRGRRAPRWCHAMEGQGEQATA